MQPHLVAHPLDSIPSTVHEEKEKKPEVLIRIWEPPRVRRPSLRRKERPVSDHQWEESLERKISKREESVENPKTRHETPARGT